MTKRLSLQAATVQVCAVCENARRREFGSMWEGVRMCVVVTPLDMQHYFRVCSSHAKNCLVSNDDRSRNESRFCSLDGRIDFNFFIVS